MDGDTSGDGDYTELKCVRKAFHMWEVVGFASERMVDRIRFKKRHCITEPLHMGGSIADGVGIGVTLPIMRWDLHLTGWRIVCTPLGHQRWQYGERVKFKESIFDTVSQQCCQNLCCPEMLPGASLGTINLYSDMWQRCILLDISLLEECWKLSFL